MIESLSSVVDPGSFHCPNHGFDSGEARSKGPWLVVHKPWPLGLWRFSVLDSRAEHPDIFNFDSLLMEMSADRIGACIWLESVNGKLTVGF